jgi:hypothetical protein
MATTRMRTSSPGEASTKQYNYEHFRPTLLMKDVALTRDHKGP